MNRQVSIVELCGGKADEVDDDRDAERIDFRGGSDDRVWYGL